MVEPWHVPMTANYEYCQVGDSVGGERVQSLTVRVDDAGQGPFLILSTERWAVDDLDRFVAMLKQALAGQTGIRDFFAEKDGDRAPDTHPADSATPIDYEPWQFKVQDH